MDGLQMTHKKKLIEVALPPDAINKISTKLHNRWAQAEMPR